MADAMVAVWAAYIKMIRDDQTTLPTPARGQQYPVRLRTIYRIGPKVQLVVVDQTLDRPLTVELPEPAPTVAAEEAIMQAAATVGLAELG